ncbi:MAG: hypothetical protein IJT87_00390 [Ruminiclostridium sp.]|nr:hypothetical protein [Ruminiclostridium sp.]
MFKTTLKRLLAAALSVTMLCGMCVNAAAEEDNDPGLTVTSVADAPEALPDAPARETDIPAALTDADTTDETPLTMSQFIAEFGSDMPLDDLPAFSASEVPTGGTPITAAGAADDNADMTAGTSYTYSCSYIYSRLTTAEKAFYDALTLACDRFMYSKLNFPVALNSRGVGYLPYGAEYKSIGQSRAILVTQLFMYSNPQYYFIRPGCTWSNGYMSPNIITDFFKYSNRKKCESAISSATKSWLKSIDKLSDPAEKERFIIEKLAAKLSYNKRAAEIISGGGITDGYDQTIAGAFYKKDAVCAAYSQAVSYLCNAAGLQCFSVSGKNHQWNVVKIFGNWYELDLTWYDSSSSKTSGEKWINRSYAAFKAQDPNGSHIYNTGTWSYIAPPDCKYTGIKYPDPTGYNVMVKGGSIYKGMNTYEEAVKLIESQKNKEASYVITFNKTLEVKKLTFPKYAWSVTLAAASGAHIRTKSTSISPKGSLTISANIVNSNNKPLSIKVPSNSVLTISKALSNIGTVSGAATSALFVNASLSAKTIGSIGELSVGSGGTVNITEKGRINVKELFMHSGANISITKNSQLKVTELISGDGSPKITLSKNCKPLEITAKNAYGKIYLKSSTSFVGKQVVTAKKIDPNLLFDISGIVPKVSSGTYTYGMYVKKGKATVVKFALAVNGRKFAYWNDMIGYISTLGRGSRTIELLGDYTVDKTLKLPSPKSVSSLTINGNSHDLTLTSAVTVDMKYPLTLKSMTLIPHKSFTVNVNSGNTLTLTGVKSTRKVSLVRNGGKISGSILYL